MRLPIRWNAPAGVALAQLVCSLAWALPAPPPLRFIAPTPGFRAVVSAPVALVRLEAACSFDEGTLAASFNGTPIPIGDLLPFLACANGRKTTQTAVVTLALPNGSITSGPTSLEAGQAASFAGTTTADHLRWNFDGGAAPVEGIAVSPVFSPAGDFTVRAQAGNDAQLLASGMDGGNLVSAVRDFEAGDPSPDTHSLTVIMPPDVDFVNWESSHVHPVALSESGDELYAVNTPEGRLSIFEVEANGSLTLAASVVVGLDPVSLTQRPGTSEVWVVNHLSDAVTIVDAATHKVLDILEAGDEPTDVAFASGRAFVSISGQRDAVVVFDAETRAQLAIVDLFGDDPRALAASADGTEVYAVVLESGNGTTALFHDIVTDNGGLPPPSPPRTAPGQAPNVGLIVKFDPADGRWKDDAGGDWSDLVDFDLPDQDLFVIDADAATPSVIGTVDHLGTILFDVALRPGTTELFVPNIDARNLVRFEPNLRGHIVETRISVVDLATSNATPVDLNSHINYAVTPGPPSELAQSLAHPGDGAFSSDGLTYYVTAFGSSKVGVVDAATGAVVGRIQVGGGPSGLALNEADQRLYVMNRFENTLSVVDTAANATIETVGVASSTSFDPSPDVIKIGREFLYDGEISSGHGDTACATCHIFGNFDNIAWDLGDPQGDFVSYAEAPWVQFFTFGPSTPGFDPMKGPMTTQTLRGLENLAPFHWRGDRENFQHFNGAFVSLMGRDSQLSATDMDAFTDFINTVRFPPNPYRNLDNSFPAAITVPDQATGEWTASGSPSNGQSEFVNSPLAGGAFTCNQCHQLPTGTSSLLFNGQLEGETQDFKIPHMRNMYEKVGFDVIRPDVLNGNASNIGLASHKRGFGFLHDGSVSLTEFLAAELFQMDTQLERDMFAFSLAFPTETPACAGALMMVDVNNRNDPAVVSFVSTIIAQAEQGECDVIASGSVAGEQRGYLYDPATDQLETDSLLDGPFTVSQLGEQLVVGDVLLVMGAPPGAGRRLALDRDRDGWLNRSEGYFETDPADPNSNWWQW